MQRRLVLLPDFEESLAALDPSPETAQIVHALMDRARAHPESAPMMPEMTLRLLRSRTYGGYPALRLFYRCDADTVVLYYIEPYDELTVAGGGN